MPVVRAREAMGVKHFFTRQIFTGRFFTGLCLGLVLSVGIACSQRVLVSEPAAPSAPAEGAAIVSPTDAREGAASAPTAPGLVALCAARYNP